MAINNQPIITLQSGHTHLCRACLVYAGSPTTPTPWYAHTSTRMCTSNIDTLLLHLTASRHLLDAGHRSHDSSYVRIQAGWAVRVTYLSSSLIAQAKSPGIHVGWPTGSYVPLWGHCDRCMCHSYCRSLGYMLVHKARVCGWPLTVHWGQIWWRGGSCLQRRERM